MNKLVCTFAIVLAVVCLVNAAPKKSRADEEQSGNAGNLPDMSNNPMMGMMTTLMNSFGSGNAEGGAGRDGFGDMFGGMPTMPAMEMPTGMPTMPAMEMPTGFPDMSALTGGGEGGSE